MILEEIGLWLILVLTCFFCAAPELSRADTHPTCRPEDFHYEFTECDDTGGRWRVSVPTPGLCIGGAPNPPERDNCTTSCEAGTFYDRNVLRCEACPAGTYSLGGGIRFETWTRLPTGFESNLESVGSSFRFLQRGSEGPVNCSQYAWKPSGNSISSEGGPCSAILTYSVKLVKSGVLSFEYQYTDDMVLFSFEAQNDRCQIVRQQEKYQFPSKTEEGEWRTITVTLGAGLNVLYWKTLGMGGSDYFDRSPRPVRIKSVTITGVSYTSECTPCLPGTSSSARASHCTSCPENQYSKAGASQCIACDEPTQYAPVGAEECIERPPCSSLDYYTIFSQCNEQTNKSLIMYMWREPKICSDKHNKSITLPKQLESNSCMECNPGMEQSKYSNCTFCAPNTFSRGTSRCKPCSASTAPNYGLFYHVWHQVPPYMTSKCIAIAEGTGCSSNVAWIEEGTYIRSGQGHSSDSYLVLSLDVGGFRSRERIANGQASEIGTLRITFELNCTLNCDFVFMEASSRNDLKIINSWKGNQKRQTYSYSIRRNDTYNFTWAFQKVPYTLDGQAVNGTADVTQDVAKIYDITVTNTIRGGASECSRCQQKVDADGCIPCPAGHYFERNRCIQCPPNTYVTDREFYGHNACKPCGAGLRSDDRQTCYSDCKITMGLKSHVNFSGLPKFMSIKGSPLFTSSGMHFHHIFNLSLCGKSHTQALCKNNVTSQVTEVMSSVCRMTIVPSQGDGEGRTIATQAVSIGDWLIGVTHNSTYQNISVTPKFLKDPSDSVNDIHFYYIATGRTTACPNGRNTTVTLRCDHFARDPGEILPPEGCPDGTCDGCVFHFLWKTRKACRICNKEDYEIVKGECQHGSQTLHYIAPSGCIASLKGDDKVPKTRTQACTVIPFELQTLIAGSVGLGVLLLAMLLYCWKKNRKLEYKYMKLVQSGPSKEGELPTAESCAIYDDDDDQYDAVVTSGSGRSSLLSKFQTGRGSHDDSSERIHLTKNRSQL